MSRYVDADNAVERLGEYLMIDAQIEYGGSASEDIEDWKELASDILKGTPSIDIVRCVECRYKGMEICPMYKLTKAGVLKPYDFCSYGERADRKTEDIVKSFGFKTESYRQAKAKTEQTERSE